MSVSVWKVIAAAGFATLVAAWGGACAGSNTNDGEAPPPAKELGAEAGVNGEPGPSRTERLDLATPRVFRQEVPGTAFAFEMVEVPGSADGSIKPFAIGRLEMTWEPFDVYVYRLDAAVSDVGASGADAVSRPSKPYLPPDRGFGHEGFAAISMSHQNAAEFCKWLSAKTGRVYRLPTEAEWEHACCAGGVSGSGAGLAERAWFAGNSGDVPHAAGTRLANAWGLHDMQGNVAEWCDGRDGKPVTKGGSFRDDAEEVSCGARAVQTAAWNMSDPQVPKSKWWLANGEFVGFRVVCEVE